MQGLRHKAAHQRPDVARAASSTAEVTAYKIIEKGSDSTTDYRVYYSQGGEQNGDLMISQLSSSSSLPPFIDTQIR